MKTLIISSFNPIRMYVLINGNLFNFNSDSYWPNFKKYITVIVNGLLPYFTIAYYSTKGTINVSVFKIVMRPEDRYIGTFEVDNKKCKKPFFKNLVIGNTYSQFYYLCKDENQGTNYDLRLWNFFFEGPFYLIDNTVKSEIVSFPSIVKTEKSLIDDYDFEVAFDSIKNVAYVIFNYIFFQDKNEFSISTNIAIIKNEQTETSFVVYDLESNNNLVIDGSFLNVKLMNPRNGLVFKNRLEFLSKSVILQNSDILTPYLTISAFIFLKSEIFTFYNYYFQKNRLEMESNIVGCRQADIIKDHNEWSKQLSYLVFCRVRSNNQHVLTDLGTVRIYFPEDDLDTNVEIEKTFVIVEDKEIKIIHQYRYSLFIRIFLFAKIGETDSYRYERCVSDELDIFPRQETLIENLFAMYKNEHIYIFYH